MLNQWVTAQECVGVSCFPGHDVNIRRHLEKLVANQPELRRKRAGSKALEFHISALPVAARAELLLKSGQVETSQGLLRSSAHRLNLWIMDVRNYGSAGTVPAMHSVNWPGNGTLLSC